MRKRETKEELENRIKASMAENQESIFNDEDLMVVLKEYVPDIETAYYVFDTPGQRVYIFGVLINGTTIISFDRSETDHSISEIEVMTQDETLEFIKYKIRKAFKSKRDEVKCFYQLATSRKF